MSEPLARLYDLALRALDEHERRADALRGRLAPVLAAAALGASLLGGPVVGGAHPKSVVGKLAIVCAVGGLLLMTAGVFKVLTVRHHPQGRIDSRRLFGELRRDGLLADETAFYEAMIMRLGEQGDRITRTIGNAATAFTTMLCGILVMLCGLALAAIVG